MHLTGLNLLATRRVEILLIVGLLSNGKHRSFSSAVKDANDKGSARADKSLWLFCNSTGPCEPCLEGQRKLIQSHTGEHSVGETGCASTPYRQGLHCIIGSQREEHVHEMKLEVPTEYKERARGSVVVLQKGCQRPALAMASFLLFSVLMLCLSVPVVVWRKRVMRTVF